MMREFLRLSLSLSLFLLIWVGCCTVCLFLCYGLTKSVLVYRYPPKMIPAVDVIVHTTATNDRDARMLLSGLGIPFHGKHVN